MGLIGGGVVLIGLDFFVLGMVGGSGGVFILKGIVGWGVPVR